MPSFSSFASYKKLSTLAKNPVDLTNPALFTPNRIQEMEAKSDGLALLYAAERVTKETLDELFYLATETKALEKMSLMQSGSIINKISGYESENRKVLHTAMRDFFEDRNTFPDAIEAAVLAYREIEKLQKFLSKIDKENFFTDLIHIGIGGSDLGPKALYQALKPYHNKKRKVHFVSNVDPDNMASVLLDVDLTKTLVVCVSKSGTTLETQTNEEMLREIFSKKKIPANKHFVSVTGKGSPMDDPSRYLESFHIWDYVGGRFSVTSMVGGVTLSFGMGFSNFYEILHGASCMDKIALNPNMKENLPLLSALLGIWNRNFLQYPTVAVIPYTEALCKFPMFLQQLDMESNGKQVTKEGNFVDFATGPIIWGEIGTNSQHSFFQFLHQSSDVVPIEFIAFKESQLQMDFIYKDTTSHEKLLSNLIGQIIALAQGKKNDNPNKTFSGNRPSSLLIAKKLDPFTLGKILSYYEHKVAFQGFIWDINSFDQEGVQLGKKVADATLELYKARRKEGKGGVFEIGKAYLDRIDHWK